MSKHAIFSIHVGRHNPLEPGTETVIQMQGCRACLIKAITTVLLHNQEIKDIMNASIRAANETKAKQQN